MAKAGLELASPGLLDESSTTELEQSLINENKVSIILFKCNIILADLIGWSYYRDIPLWDHSELSTSLF